MAYLYAGVDIGATKISAGLWNKRKFIENSIAKTPKDARQLPKAINSLLSSFNKKPCAVGIGFPGFVIQGKVVSLPNIKNSSCLPTEGQMSRMLKIPVFFENDVKCAAIAVANSGRASNGLAVLVWPGSGIGGAIISNAKLIRGKRNCAGEFGHIPIFMGGKWQEFESICGGIGVEKRYFEIYGKKKSAKEIFNCKEARKFASQCSFSFGVGLAMIANSLNPQIIIVGGSLSNAYMGRFKQDVMRSFSKFAIAPALKTKIRRARIRNAPLVGAAIVAAMRSNQKQVH